MSRERSRARDERGAVESAELARTSERLLALARNAQRERRTVESRSLVDAAMVCATSARSADAVWRAGQAAALVLYADGDNVGAEAHFRIASKAARDVAPPLVAARIEASIAFIAYDRGDVTAAQDALDAIDAQLATIAPDGGARDELASLVVGYRGNLARHGGASDHALALYRRAIESAPTTAAGLRATFEMDAAAAELARGRPLDALAPLDRSEHAFRSVDGGGAAVLLPPLVAHYRALASLALGRATVIELDGPRALAPFREWLWDATRGGARAPMLDHGLERRLAKIASETDDFAHARVSATIARALANAPARRGVTVARDGSSIVREGRYVDLSRRAPLRRALSCIAEARLHGDVVSLEQLVQAAWPGERISRAAARNRAHVALATLRSLGLETVLVRQNDGYRLADDATVI